MYEEKQYVQIIENNGYSTNSVEKGTEINLFRFPVSPSLLIYFFS